MNCKNHYALYDYEIPSDMPIVKILDPTASHVILESIELIAPLDDYKAKRASREMAGTIFTGTSTRYPP